MGHGDGPTAPAIPLPRRTDSTTQPKLHAIAVPGEGSPFGRALTFTRALLSVPGARAVLLTDAAAAVAVAIVLGAVVPVLGRAWPLGYGLGIGLIAAGSSLSTARVSRIVSGVSLENALKLLPRGGGEEVLAVRKLRLLLLAVAAPLAVGLAFALGPTGFFGAAPSLALGAAALAATFWLRAAFAGCFGAWVFRCEQAQSFDPTLAPEPLRISLR
jgi:hypothetical protein